MDGNRRWAREHNVPVFEGHQKGYEKFKEVVRWAKEANIQTLICYAFSTENWKRTEDEVGYLMQLFETALKNEFDEVSKENARIRFIGERGALSENMQKLMGNLEDKTKNNTAITVVIAISYGGRAEIVNALRKAHSEGGDLSEEAVAQHLWTHDLPDPDIVIRTGGEKRLSNFLPWQSVYSELFFKDSYWPDFSKAEFEDILKEFSERERRHGK